MINLDKTALIKELELGALPTEVQDEIIDQLGENILLSITSEVLTQLSENDQNTFGELVKEGDEEKLRKFLLPKVPHLDALVSQKAQEEISDLKKNM